MVGIVKGAPHRALAERFLDFLLTPDAQDLFAELNCEYPVVAGVPLGQGVEPLTAIRITDVSMAALVDDREAGLELLGEVGVP